MHPSESNFAAHRIYSGAGSLRHLQAELRRAGASRVAIFCGRTLAAHPTALTLVREALGPSFVGVFDGVRAHSPSASIMAAVERLKQLDADSIVALGGGSAMVTARAASIVHAEAAPPQQLATHRDPEGRLVSPKLLAPKMPVFAVPTTPTTATPKAGSAVLDAVTGERLALFDPKTRARCIVVEPSLLATAALGLHLSASLNTLAMAITGLEADHDNDLSEALLRHAIELVSTWLPLLTRDERVDEARQRLVHASILCGQGTDLTGGGLVTALGHSLGPKAHAANGSVNAVLLPHTMRFNSQAVPHRYERILVPLRAWAPQHAPSTAEAAVEATVALLRSVSAPRTLRELGVSEEDLEAVAAHAMNDWSLASNPRAVSAEDIVTLLRAAW